MGVFLKHTVVVSGGDGFAEDCSSGSERGLSISALFKGSLCPPQATIVQFHSVYP